MNTAAVLIVAFVVLVGGLLLPLSHGLRWTLFLLLAGLVVASLMYGGIDYFSGLFQ